MALNIIGTLPLGSINLTAGAVVNILPPMLASFDAALFGSLGLGAMEADLSFQFNAALQATIALSNPFDAIAASLIALVQVQANLAAMLSLGLPAINLNASVNISANVGLMAVLAAKLGGLQALISAALSVKLPVIDLLAQLNIGASCVLASFGFAGVDTLASAGASINSYFSTGFEGILPGDQVYGVIILTKSPSASVALSGMIRTT